MTYSPSALKTYMQCPYKFYAYYIERSVAYEPGPAAQRGTHLHELMEQAIVAGWESITWDDAKSKAHAQRFVAAFKQLADDGWALHTEYAVATDGHGHALDFYDQTPANLMRCRIDLFAVHPQSDVVMVFDHKTGRKYDTDRLQLQFNAVCLQPVTQRVKYQVAFDYLDSGDLASEFVDVSAVNVFEFDPEKIAQSSCPELLLALKGASEAARTQQYPIRRNRFCAWCQARCQYAGKDAV